LTVIVTIALIDNKLLTWSFFGIVYIFAVKESLKLFQIKKPLAVFITSTFIWLFSYIYPNPPEIIFITLMIIFSIIAYNRSLEIKIFLPTLYPTIGMLYFWMLYLDYGIKSLIWLLVIVALSDVGAYYSGKKFGKRGFSPTSPNKTMEGVIGGLILGTIGGTILISTRFDNTLFEVILVSFFTSLASIFGDLFESYLKREAGVKDSGNILPGHGGVLDRVDGYLFGSVTLYILLNLITTNP